MTSDIYLTLGDFAVDLLYLKHNAYGEIDQETIDHWNDVRADYNQLVARGEIIYDDEGCAIEQHIEEAAANWQQRADMEDYFEELIAALIKSMPPRTTRRRTTL